VPSDLSDFDLLVGIDLCRVIACFRDIEVSGDFHCEFLASFRHTDLDVIIAVTIQELFGSQLIAILRDDNCGTAACSPVAVLRVHHVVVELHANIQ